jgi:hypothetical protein
MTYREDTSSYNSRRYGKPWIAKLDFSTPGKPKYEFGDWLGQPGGEGELSIECQPGDVLATGQKDHRKGRGGANHIGVVQADGKVKWGYTLAKARDAGVEAREQMTTAPTITQPSQEPEIFDPCT